MLYGCGCGCGWSCGWLVLFDLLSIDQTHSNPENGHVDKQFPGEHSGFSELLFRHG
jgi:hypothetical protein